MEGRTAEFQAIVMAAGLGSRMYPLTEQMPKALLPVGNIPMIGYVMKALEKAKFDDVIIVAREGQSQAILQYLQEVMRCKIARIVMQTIPDEGDLGTADSLRLVKDKIHTDFFVLSCDLITDVEIHRLADVHRRNDSTVSCLFQLPPPKTAADRALERKRIKSEAVGNQSDYIALDPKSNRIVLFASQADMLDEEEIVLRRSVLAKHPVIDLYTDMEDMHFYVFSKWVVDFVAEKKSISTIKGELLPYLVQKQFAAPPAEDDPLSMAPEPLPELADLGLHASNVIGGASTKERIRCFALVLKPGDEVFAGRGNTNHMYSELNKQVPKRFATLWPTSDRSELARVHPTATVAERTNVGPDSIIGEGSRVGTYSSVKKSVVGAHTTIGNKCKIINCVIMSHATIMDGSTLTNCIVCPNGYISEEANLTNCQVGNSHTVPRGAVQKNEALIKEDDFL